jgi:hypothetical protein
LPLKTHLLDMAFDLGVEAALEVGQIRFCESGATNGVSIVVVIDTTGGVYGAMNASLETEVGQIERSNSVGSYRLLLVVLAPVDIRTSSTSGAVQYMGRLDLLKLGLDCFTIFHADGCGVYLLALALEHRLKVLGNPPIATEYEPAVAGRGSIGSVGSVDSVDCHCVRLVVVSGYISIW